MYQETVLIVEDSPIQMEMLRRTLEGEGFNVIRAINGKEGLTKAFKTLPDIIISDISMPEMDGYDMCYEIKHTQSTKDIPVILFTQFSDPEDIIKGLVSGADNFIVKPAPQLTNSRTNLIEILKSLLVDRQDKRLKSSIVHPDEKDGSGIEVNIEGKNYLIHSSRRQILTLLLSTYESAVKRNNELTKAHLELKTFNEHLENMVQERTSELMKSELRYKALIESASDGILITDIETGSIRYGNQEICNMFGYTLDELQKMYIDQLYNKVKDIKLQNIEDTGSQDRRLIQCIKKDGKVIYCDFSSTKTTIDNKICTLSFVRDVSDKMEAEKILSKLNKKVKSAQKDLSDFSYVMSHDLKTPLRAIVTLADWIETDYFEEGQKGGLRSSIDGRKKLAMLVGRVRRIHDLIDGILRYSSISEHGEKTIVDMNQLVSEVVSIINPSTNIVPYKISTAKDMPKVLCEKSRIEEVFLCLLSNAVKYNDKPNPDIYILYEDNATYWKFGVKDNGRGIEEKYFKKIFQIFQTLRDEDRHDSIGLGLSIAQKIIELHGGHIWIESEVNIGTTVFFTLPKEV